MTERKDAIMTEEKEVVTENNTQETPKPILPDEEYAAKVSEEDPEELEHARKRVMTMVRIKGKNIGGDVLANQIEPMVYSMSIADCESMYNVLKRHGMIGLMNMLMKHNKEVAKSQKEAEQKQEN